MGVTGEDGWDRAMRRGGVVSRRGLLAGSGLLVVAGGRAAGAQPRQGPPDIGVYCEPTLAPVMTALGQIFAAGSGGAPVAVLMAPADLILLQVKQNPAEDLLILPAASMDKAAARSFIDASSRWDAWKNPLVLAERAHDGATMAEHALASAATPAGLQTMLATGKVAATDPTPASTLDGVGLLGRLGVADSLAGRIIGVPNTADAAFLVQTGAARFGLMYATDVRASRALAVAAILDPGLAPAVVFAVALNTRLNSRNARPFLEFLRTPDAGARLRQAGLEPV